MLQLKNIDVWFDHKHILRDLSCEVEPGDFVVIVGANGAGKSTFFDTIAGKIIPQKGTIILDGSDITKQSEQQRAGMVTRIFQNTQLNSVGSLTVAQNLAMAHYSRRPARLVDGMQAMPKEYAEKLIREVGMDRSILKQPMDTLSGGQRQLIAFVMATRLIPKILLLDEPTAALDPQAATTLLRYAAQFIKQHSITTLLITHDPHIALSIGNKIWILENGKITKQYNAQEKKNLNPDRLIGQIDYKQISTI
jgi:putative tryptophan/tyrosine transport system ATP-binding protein